MSYALCFLRAQGYSDSPDHGFKLRALDVGSCYNPFGNVDFMDTSAIDLSPANPNVHKCDFLTVPLTDDDEIWFSREVRESGSKIDTVTGLPKDRYDVVIFSLLLEYLPTPGLRYEAVRRAAELLTEYGLLVIVTPDSSHQVCNSIHFILLIYKYLR